MDPTPDELAGVVDLFGALTRAELGQGLAELAFKRGQQYDPDEFEKAIEEARRSYHLVAVDATSVTGMDADTPDESEALAVGPAAFPTLPDGASDLPHILDVSERHLDEETTTEAATDQFREDAVAALDRGDDPRVRTLVDLSYELEAWGNLDLSATRERLDAELD